MPANARARYAVCMFACVPVFSIVLLGNSDAVADDWPTYRHDVARSGVTTEHVSPPLTENWVFKTTHPPRPAWGDPNPNPLGGEGFRELRRVHFDDVFQVVAVDGAVYFGSSADNKVYCLDASTGQIRWTKITGGPIRLAPTIVNGRVFFGSDDGQVYCLAAREGSVIWTFRAARDNISHNAGNLALDHNGLFVAVGERCLRLDPATGRTKNEYELPPAEDDKPHTWGYVACVGNLLFGSRVADASSTQQADWPRGPGFNHRKWDDALSQADALFALEIETGEPRWVHRDRPFPQNSISIGDGTVFLVSPTVTDSERQEAVDERRRLIELLPEPQRTAAKDKVGADAGRVVALDAGTGRIRWQKPIDLTGCGGEAHGKINWTGMGAKLATMYHDGVLVIFGVYLDGHHWADFFAGRFADRWITALRAADGETAWSRPVGFRVRPLIIGETLVAEPWKLDLHTGKPEMRAHPITGRPSLWQFARPGHHCGTPSASPNCLFFRSFTLGYYDLLGDFGTIHFGGQRPGCWINAIPAAGLVMVPEASAGCTCTFPNACTVVFQPSSTNKAWGMVSAPGPVTPVRRLALNLGISGDRRDAAGNLWLGYPRPYGNPPPGYPKPGGALLLRFDLKTEFYPGGRFDKRNSTYADVTGTENGWLLTSGAFGLRKMVVPILTKNDGPASYRVRLAFAAPVGDVPGQRVFDVKLQNQLVAKSYDVVQMAGSESRAVFKEFSGIEVNDNLVLEFVAKTAQPSQDQWPILQAMEIVRTARSRGQ